MVYLHCLKHQLKKYTSIFYPARRYIAKTWLSISSANIFTLFSGTTEQNDFIFNLVSDKLWEMTLVFWYLNNFFLLQVEDNNCNFLFDNEGCILEPLIANYTDDKIKKKNFFRMNMIHQKIFIIEIQFFIWQFNASVDTCLLQEEFSEDIAFIIESALTDTEENSVVRKKAINSVRSIFVKVSKKIFF